MVVIVVLGACGVQMQVALFMVCLLEQDICADAGVLELSIVLDGGSGYIDVHTADSLWLTWISSTSKQPSLM